MGEDDAGEAELVARAQLDPAAFAPLYRQYFNPVCRYCYLRLGSWEAAEDAAGTVFARALAALPRLTYREGSFSGWLFTIAANVVANDRRSRRRFEPLEEVAALVDTTPTPEDLVLATDRHETLKRLLAQLPAAQREVVELRLAGLTGAEIAQAVGRSHTAVRMLQVRAVDRLQTLLGTASGNADASEGGQP